MMTLRQISRIVSKLNAPLKRKVQIMIGRCVILAVDDSTKVQSLKLSILSDEVTEDIERFQEYGFTSVPYPDAEGITVSVGGQRSHTVVIATDDRTRRPTGLLQGDTVLYNSNGTRVKLDDAVDQVLLGNLPTQFVALENLVQTALDDIRTFINGHGHVTTATVGTGPVAPPSAAPSPALGALGPVAAAEVKAK